MTATINDLVDDPFADLPRRGTCPDEDFAAPVLTIAVNDNAVLAIARRLHDGTCRLGDGCGLRDFHAMDVYETHVRVMLAALVQAGSEADGSGISSCRMDTERRWFQGKWRCAACGGSVRYGGGIGWVHVS